MSVVSFPPLRPHGLLTLAGSVNILHGACSEQMRLLPDASVHCVITSPPYFNLRRYHEDSVWEGGDPACDHLQPGGQRTDTRRHNVACATGTFGGFSASSALQQAQYATLCGKCGARRVVKQIGLEETVDDYVQALVGVFREIWRVLRPDGTAWLVLGDSYATTSSGYAPNAPSNVSGQSLQSRTRGKVPRDVVARRRDIARSGDGRQSGSAVRERWQGTAEADPARSAETRPPTTGSGLKHKDLCLVPHRVGLALQADGWWVRNDVIWHKRVCLPESVTDRMTSSHEHIWLLSKGEEYFYDHEPIREAPKPWTQATLRAASGVLVSEDEESQQRQHDRTVEYEELKGANRRDVWSILPTVIVTPEDHPAMFPLEIPTLAVQAATSEAGVCPHCGAPWRRLERAAQSWVQGTKPSRERPDGRAMIDGRFRDGLAPGLKEFRQDCQCPAHQPVPAVVLDPFGGAGTTALAAAMQGRNSVIIELSAKYIEGSMQRLQREGIRCRVVSPDPAEAPPAEAPIEPVPG